MFSFVIFRAQFTYISNPVLAAWKSGDLEEAEDKLGDEIRAENEGNPLRNSYAHVNRALLRVRRRKWDDALKDVRAIMVARFTSHRDCC